MFQMIQHVVKFELSRSMTWGRISLWLVLVAFPVALVAALRLLGMPLRLVEEWGTILYFLVPEVVCLLALLLWATPVVSTEIEGQTWGYLAMRPAGRSVVIIGKYVTALIWAFSAAMVSLSICVPLMGPVGGFKLWLVMSALCFLSVIAHGALYLLIGVVFHRRTIVTAVFYTGAIEYGLSLVPALANKFTINYRLRGLLSNWMGWEQARSVSESALGSDSTTMHITVLLVMASTLLVITLVRVRRSEFPTQQVG